MEDILLTHNEFLEKELWYISEIQEGNETWESLANFRAAYTGKRWHSDTFRKGSLLLNEFNQAGWVTRPSEDTAQENMSISISENGTQTSEGKFKIDNVEDLKDEKFLLKLHRYDISNWKIVSSKSSIWQSGEKTLYSSKISVKPILSVTNDFVSDLLAMNMKNPHNSKLEPFKISKSGKMLEVNIADVHLGKLCWEGETGESYDYKIATKNFKYLIQDILEQVSHLEFEQILFIWCNDFFHYDTTTGTTTAGTPQDSDLRWKKMFRVGVDLLTWAIDVLSEKAPVKTFYISSNHDEQTGYYATNYLYAWYRDSPNVTVDVGCKGRKFVEFGNTMIAFCHGSSEGKNINNIMSTEEPEMFGRTKFRYVHAGHFHSKQGKDIIEDNGCLVRYLGSPTGTDAWHYSKGYLGAVKCGYGFVYDKLLGQRMEITSNIL